jgi:hypothetical protein
MTPEFKAQMRKVILQKYPELRGKLKIYRRHVTVIGWGTTYYAGEVAASTPEKEAEWWLIEYDFCNLERAKNALQKNHPR